MEYANWFCVAWLAARIHQHHVAARIGDALDAPTRPAQCSNNTARPPMNTSWWQCIKCDGLVAYDGKPSFCPYCRSTGITLVGQHECSFPACKCERAARCPDSKVRAERLLAALRDLQTTPADSHE